MTVQLLYTIFIYLAEQPYSLFILKRNTTMTISVHEEMNPLKRSTMEDGHLVLKPSTWNCYDPNMWFLGK